MVIAPMLDQQGLNLAVPEVVNSENIKNDAKIMNVSVSSDNKFFIEGRVEDKIVFKAYLKTKNSYLYKKYSDNFMKAFNL